MIEKTQDYNLDLDLELLEIDQQNLLHYQAKGRIYHIYLEVNQTQEQKEVFKCLAQLVDTCRVEKVSLYSQVPIVEPLPAMNITALSLEHSPEVAVKESILEINAENFPHLQFLQLHHVASDFKFPVIESLERIICRDSTIKNFPLEILDCQHLKCLDLSKNDIRELPKKLSESQITSLFLNDNDIKKIKHLPFHTLQTLELRNNDIDSISEETATFIAVNALIRNESQVDIRENRLSTQSCSKETWKILTDSLGIQETYRLFLDKQKPIFQENQATQIQFLEQVAAISEKKIKTEKKIWI